eukprot:947088-Amphidinium_carterae.1
MDWACVALWWFLRQDVQRILAITALDQAASSGRLWQTFLERDDLKRFEQEVTAETPHASRSQVSLSK